MPLAHEHAPPRVTPPAAFLLESSPVVYKRLQLTAHEFIRGLRNHVDKMVNRFNGLMREDFDVLCFDCVYSNQSSVCPKTDESVAYILLF